MTAKTVSPTKPLEVDEIPEGSTVRSIPNLFDTTGVGIRFELRHLLWRMKRYNYISTVHDPGR